MVINYAIFQQKHERRRRTYLLFLCITGRRPEIYRMVEEAELLWRAFQLKLSHFKDSHSTL